MTVGGVVAHQMPYDRPVTDADEWFGCCLGVLTQPRAEPTAKQDDFHSLLPVARAKIRYDIAFAESTLRSLAIEGASRRRQVIHNRAVAQRSVTVSKRMATRDTGIQSRVLRSSSSSLQRNWNS